MAISLIREHFARGLFPLWYRWQLSCHSFWQAHPALLYGVALILGCYGAFFFIESLLFALLTLFAPLWPRLSFGAHKSLFLGLCVAAASWLFTSWYYIAPQLPHDGISGHAYFQIQTLLDENPSFARYQGVLQDFQASASQPISIRHVPVTICLKPPYSPYIEGLTYKADGRLTQKGRTLYYFHGQPLTLATKCSPHTGWREKIKDQLDQSLRSHVGQGTTYAFLRGLATGQVSHAELQFELGRFGLQHLMAISGFHFSLLMAFLTLLLRTFFRGFILTSLLAILLTLYALVIGFSPSLGRAWIASLCLLFGALVERKSSSLNAMGVGMIVMFCIEPLSCLQLSFQFSFLCTAAILFFYRPLEAYLQWLWPQHLLSTYLRMPGYQKIAYILISLLRKTLALSLAVHLAAIPLVLFVFGKFPWMSLVYNLFYPYLATLAFLLLLLAGLFAWLPCLTSFFYCMAKFFADWMLNLARLLPQRFDACLDVRLPGTAISVYFVIFLILGIHLYHRARMTI